MADPIFYAAATDQKEPHPITGYVPSKFLIRVGAYVVDPIPGASQNANLYSDAAGSDQTDGKIANPNNYVVVPANHSEQEARKFASDLAAASRMGVAPTLALMTSAFWPGGSQELQRNLRWGIPPNSFVRAYTSAASDHFGYITAAAGLPQELAEYGGGIHNIFSKQLKPDVDVSGKGGLSRVNEANIAQGYAAGHAAGKPPIAFNDYGYGAQPRPAAGEIGGGNGFIGDQGVEICWMYGSFHRYLFTNLALTCRDIGVLLGLYWLTQSNLGVAGVAMKNVVKKFDTSGKSLA